MALTPGCSFFGFYKVLPFFIFKPKTPDLKVIKNHDECAKYIKQGVMNPDYTPKFTIAASDYNKQYRSVFGPYFNIQGLNHSGQGEGENRAMVSRMIALREHGCVDAGRCHLCTSVPARFDNLDDYLKFKQVGLRRHLRNSLFAFKKWFYDRIEFSDARDAHRAWVVKQNSKRKLRIRVCNRSIDDGRVDCDDNKPVQFKGKVGELLGNSKRRGTGDLGVYRTNATAFAFDAFKTAMEGEYAHGNYIFRFAASPSVEILQDVFDRMASIPKGHVYFVYFSDDGVLGVNCADGIAWFNTDLKQCDGSHFSPFLELVEHMLSTTPQGAANSYSGAVHRAYSYLRRHMVVRNQYNYKQKVSYRFTSMRMYSGFAGTTITNNFANLFIGFCLQKRVPNPADLTKAEFIKVFELSAADAGYICHLQVCTRFEDLQFLKHSPVLSDVGIYVPTMNLGVYLRGFGTFYGDLPSSGRYEDTARAFVSEVVESRIGWGNHMFNRAFHHLIIKHGVSFHRSAAYGAAMEMKQHGSCGSFIPLDSLCVRYRCTVSELEELVALIGVMDVGYAVDHPLVQRIYSYDYG